MLKWTMDRRSLQRTLRLEALLRGLLWTALAGPLVLHLAVLPEYGRLQRDDYYGVLRQVFDEEGRSAEPAAWWRARINVHRVAVPALIWGANVRLFDGHNLPTALLGLACLAGIAAVLALRMPPVAPAAAGAAGGAAGRAPPEARLLPAALAFVVVLQPVAGHNLAKSFSAIHTFLAALFAVAAMAVLERRAAPRPGPLWPLFPLAVLGPLTFSSELATWPALAAGALALRLRGRDLVIVGAAAAVAAATYLAGRPPPVPAEVPVAGLVLRYLGVFLGAPFGGDLATARVAGWLLLAAGVAATAAAFARGADRRLPAFWLMVQLYVLGNGVLAALGRAAEFGEASAASVRYAMYSALFLLATAGAATCAARRRRRAAWLVAAAVALAAVPLYQRGLRAMALMVEQGRRQPLAELGLRLGLEDTWHLVLVTPNPRGVMLTLPTLRALGHVPFDRPPLALPGPFAAAPLAPPGPEVGRLGRVLATRDPALVHVSGWLERAEGAGGEVLFLDREGRRASAISVYRPLGEPDALRWEGFALRQGEAGPGTAYLRRAPDGRLVPLGVGGRARRQIERLGALRSRPASRGADAGGRAD